MSCLCFLGDLIFKHPMMVTLLLVFRFQTYSFKLLSVRYVVLLFLVLTSFCRNLLSNDIYFVTELEIYLHIASAA